MYRKLTELTTELLTGAASIAEAESDSRVMEEYQREAERSREELQRYVCPYKLFVFLPAGRTQHAWLVV